MFDILKEKGLMLSSLGSFWYKTLEDDASYTPNKLTHIPFLSLALYKLRHIISAALGNDRISTGLFTLRFNDNDIKGNTLLIPINTLVTSLFVGDTIQTKDTDFIAGYGFIEFNTDPRALFPKMRILVRLAIRREHNILNYPLGTWGVVGDITLIVEYYRNNLSVSLLYKASALACGMIVIKLDDTIKQVIDITDTHVVYLTNKNYRYDVLYPHEKLQVHDIVRKGQVIGGELYKLYTDFDDIEGVQSVELLHTCPTFGIRIPNEDNVVLYRDGKFKPDYTGLNVEKYWEYLDTIGAAELPLELPDRGNPLKHFMECIAPNRTIVVRIDTTLPETMRKDLYKFLITNAPIGSIVLPA